MKIVHLSKNDLSGGAARAAYRQHRGLRQAGHDSLMLVAFRTSEDPSVVAFEKPMDRMSLARRGLRQLRYARDFERYRHSRPSGYDLFSEDRSPYGASLLPQIPPCEVINLHWVPGFIDYQEFFRRVPDTTPVVWTFHDLNALTGGCHYDFGCDRYVTGCGRCPQLGSHNDHDLSHQVFERKRRLFESIPTSRLHCVALSRWLAAQVKRSPFFGRFPLAVIPNGLDLDEFSPRPRKEMRDLLGVPQDARVLLFVAEDVENRRKGFGLLIEALARCVREIPDVFLLSVGQNKPDVHLDSRWLHLGSVNNDRFLSMVYSAADLYVICSLQDNFPNTVLEAMACGVPVVGHAIGGIPDMIRSGVNGMTVAPGDIEALAEAITLVLNDRARCAEMGANARTIAVNEYSVERQARRYAELYASLI